MTELRNVLYANVSSTFVLEFNGEGNRKRSVGTARYVVLLQDIQHSVRRKRPMRDVVMDMLQLFLSFSIRLCSLFVSNVVKYASIQSQLSPICIKDSKNG